MLESPSTTPTTARTPLTIGEVGFREIPARITGNKLLLTFENLTVGETYTLITKATKSVTANDISRQDIVASNTSENVDLDLPLGVYHNNEDYFLALSIGGQELIQAKFQITERLTDSGGEVILQYLSADYTLSGDAISTANKILDKNSKTSAIDGSSTNDQWASAKQIYGRIEEAKPPEFYDFIVGASSQADYQYNGTDISVALNSAITALGSEGGSIYIEKGNYAIVNSINPTGKSNITIIGGGKKRTTIIGDSLAISYFNLSDSVNRFNTKLSGFTLDNTTPAVGSVGITFDKNKDGFFQNITVRNFETGYVLKDDTLYNNYINVDSEDCKNDVIIKDQGLPSNSNNFYGCKFLADKNLVNGALGIHNPLSIESGNQNTFTACVFENFTTGLNIDGVGNSFTANRLESNDITGSVVYINFGADSKNNQFVSNYYSGNDWVNRTTSIVDSGDGNSFYEGNNFKDQFVQFTRNILTAGSVVEYKRTGSGDGHAIYNATDTFPNSGNPISYLASGVRPTHKFHSGELNGTENYYVNGNGLGFFAGGLDVDNNKIINVAPPTLATDAVNKGYVDQALQYKISDYASVLDENTDNTVAFEQALQDIYNNGGGQLLIDGYCRVDGQITVPNDGNYNLPKQPPIRIYGTGSGWTGYFTNADYPYGESVLDLRDSSVGEKAKFVTRGAGSLYFDRLTILSGGSDDKTMLMTTNTTIFSTNVNYVGNRNKRRRDSVQDCWILAGDGTDPKQTLDDEVFFQGYGSLFDTNYYSNLRTLQIFNSQVNSIEIRNETVSNSCGGGAGSAMYEFNYINSNNRILGGTYEIGYYDHFVVCNDQCYRNFFLWNGLYDFTEFIVSVFRLNDQTNGNTIHFNHNVQLAGTDLIDGTANKNNQTIFSNAVDGFNHFARPLLMGDNDEFQITNTGYLETARGAGYIVVDTNEDQAYTTLKQNGTVRGYVGFANSGQLVSGGQNNAMVIRGENAIDISIGATPVLQADTSFTITFQKIKITGTNPAIDIDSATTANWILLKQNGTIRGYIGYASTGGLFANGQNNAIAIRSQEAIDIGIGADSILKISSAKKVSIGGTGLEINSNAGHNAFRLVDSYTPTSSADTNGQAGQITWDDNYIYVKTSTGWKRSSLSTF